MRVSFRRIQRGRETQEGPLHHTDLQTHPHSQIAVLEGRIDV